MVSLLERYFWIIGVIFALWEHYLWRANRSAAVAQKPELADTYARVMWCNTLFFAIPWLVMGFGIMVGGAQSVFDFLRPCSGNPFVAAFHLTIILLISTLSIWVWFFGGGVYLARYMERSPLVVKLQFAGATLFILLLLGNACWQS